MRTKRVTAIAVGIVLVGIALSVLVASAQGVSRHDCLVLVAMSLGGTPVAAFAGWLSLRRLRHKSFVTQAIVVAIGSVLAMAIGVAIAANAMFISTHDLTAVMIVLISSGALGLGAAIQLGAQVQRASAELGEMTRRLGSGEQERDDAPPIATAELAALQNELTTISRALRESQDRERSLEAGRRELIAWVSHDLRSPLAGVRAMAEAIADGVVTDNETVVRYSQSISAESQRLAALVDDLFELSRIHHGSLSIVTEPLDLGAAIAEAIDHAEAGALRRQVKIGCRIEPGTMVLASPRDLSRVLHNLVDNAVRHTNSGGSVMLESHVDHTNVVVTVTDECGGIPDEDIERVFEMAFRGDQARQRDHAGGGLGLAIAKGLIEAHQGSIGVANHARGCRFTITLPRG